MVEAPSKDAVPAPAISSLEESRREKFRDPEGWLEHRLRANGMVNGWVADPSALSGEW